MVVKLLHLEVNAASDVEQRRKRYAGEIIRPILKLKRGRISDEWFTLVGVCFEVQPFAGWISAVKANVASVRIALLIGEGANNGYAFKHCEKGLGDLNARLFHEVVGPGGVSDSVYYGIF